MDTWCWDGSIPHLIWDMCLKNMGLPTIDWPPCWQQLLNCQPVLLWACVDLAMTYLSCPVPLSALGLYQPFPPGVCCPVSPDPSALHRKQTCSCGLESEPSWAVTCWSSDGRTGVWKCQGIRIPGICSHSHLSVKGSLLTALADLFLQQGLSWAWQNELHIYTWAIEICSEM